jgi:serine/threonine protein kinase
MSLETGDLLGRYEVLAPLGAGGMGEVYKVRDLGLEREVALKVLPAETLADGALPVEQALRYGAQVADALETAELGGVIAAPTSRATEQRLRRSTAAPITNLTTWRVA